MKRIVLGLSVLLVGVAWLTPQPAEQQVTAEQATAAADDPSLGLVLGESESELGPGVLPETERGQPIAARAALPVR